MVTIVPKDFECSICLCNLAPRDGNDPTVMIESCGEYTHKECIEGRILVEFENAVSHFFSNTVGSIWEFQSLEMRYLTPKQHFSIKEVVYNHSIDEVWAELGDKEFIEKDGFNSSYECLAPKELQEYFREQSPGTLSLDVIRKKLGASRNPVYGTEEWDLLHWISFGARLIYNLAVAVIVELGLEIGILIGTNLFDVEDARANTKAFRDGNVSHRLTPLFKEYWGMTYNPSCEDSFETKAWKWIRARTI